MAVKPAPFLPDIRKANKAELAEFFGVSIPTIEAWVRKGCPVLQRGSKTIPWVFDLLDVARWRIAPVDEDGEEGADPAKLPPAERKAWFESELKRRELQVQDGELVQAVELERSIATAFSAIAQAVRAVPDNLERRAGCGPEAAEAVGALLDEAMSALADKLAQLSPAVIDDAES